MKPSAPLIAASAVWVAWGMSWLAATRWRGPTAARGPVAATRGWLLMAAAGFAGLFAERPGRFRSFYTLPPLGGWTLVALTGAGLAFAWWARIHLGSLWSGGIVARERHRVVDGGPYALVRHPIYTGLFMGAAGLAALKATPLAFAGAALLIAGFAGKARAEERFLAATLGGDAYARYRARVPMLLPWRRG